jgi:diadenosine tetraphosphate (Ap4A) HIT family hydrolase
MKTNPDECLYCTKNQMQKELMIKICDLSVSELFLFKEQSYHGRTLVAYKGHVDGLFELNDEERNAFMADVTNAATAMNKAFHPDKINFGAYSDTLSHLHFHIVPKYQGGYGWGGVFEMNPKKTYLTDEEYTQTIEAIKAAL